MAETKPLYLLAGGGPHKPEKEIFYISQALKDCGSVSPKVAYIGTASCDNILFFNFIKAILKKAGASEVRMVKLAKPGADIASAKQTMSSADMIFLSGGEVDDGMDWLVRHKLVEFLCEMRSQGKVFLGISAGAIMMGAKWVKWVDEKDDSTASLFDCLGFVPTTFDTHAEDEDWKELKMALKLQGPGSHGYGIHRGGMIIADSCGKLEAVGEPLLYYGNNNGLVETVPL